MVKQRINFENFLINRIRIIQAKEIAFVKKADSHLYEVRDVIYLEESQLFLLGFKAIGGSGSKKSC